MKKTKYSLLLFMGLVWSSILTSCQSGPQLTPEEFLAELVLLKDSAAYYSQEWNKAATHTLSSDKDYEELKNKREVFEQYSQRAAETIRKMDEPGVHPKETKAEFLKLITQNEKMLQDLSVRMEALANETNEDSLRYKKDNIMYESNKYLSDLDDQFFRVMNYTQLYELNNELKKD